MKRFITSPMNIFVVLVFALAVFPIIILGRDSIFTIHDGLNPNIAWAKMLKDNGLLLALNSPTNQMGNMSTAYFALFPYNILTLPYLFFDVFTAHVIGYVMKIIIGYISMYLLLSYCLPNKESKIVVYLVSMSFALLPSASVFWVVLDSVPLLILAFLLIIKLDNKNINKRVFLLMLYPLLSSFTFAGFFILVTWVLVTLGLWIYQKKLNINLIIGLICLVIGYILVDLKLFYSMFVLQTPTIRELNLFGYNTNMPLFSMAFFTDVLEGFKDIPVRFTEGLIVGRSVIHNPIIGIYLIFPLIFITLIYITALFLYRKVSNQKFENVIKAEDTDIPKFCLLIIILLGVTYIFSSIGTLNQNISINKLISTFVPFFKGFNWGRFYLLNRTIIYICFALALCIWLKLLYNKKAKYIVYIIAFFQVGLVLLGPVMYGYSAYNINHGSMVKIDKNLTFNEFYAEEFFEYIKKDLRYNGEGVVALGYYPSVLMYNGFSCLDGFQNLMPLTYHQAFREIIAPQLSRNLDQKLWYDALWGAYEAYILTDDLGPGPTREKVSSPVELHINTEAFRNLGGVYILSRAEISNSDDLELTFINKYTNDSTIYEIFVYKTD